ncbi:uncharacterized protein PG998_010596 [Apiospora kogelbergensis]|uniref:uncharacterized protein n=1 Tax=Apiospora kogelbergensis TaxID=1337665 RepID=UPI00312F2D45
MSTIGQLGERIASLAKKVEEDQLRNDATPAAQQIAMELAEASRELEQLVLGPRQALGVIVTFDIPNLVPEEGSVSYAELSSLCGLDEDRLTRILRYVMINHIFREAPAGRVRHTPQSAHLAQSPAFCDFLRTIAAVFLPACAAVPAALARWPRTRATTEAAHGAARRTDAAFYDWLDRDENAALRRNFDRGMEGISRAGQRLQDTDLRAYPWGALPAAAAVVDVGGFGDLAAAYPSFSIVVQDLPRVIRQTMEDQKNASGPESVTYQAHNCFDEQPVKNADVYFMRHVFHNHPDAECIKILTALLPALKPGSRVLVSEYIVPPAAELSGGLSTKAMSPFFILSPTPKNLLDQTLLTNFALSSSLPRNRQMDLLTMALFNAKERTKEEYSRLFEQASPALVFHGTHQVPDDPRSCVFEAVYQGGETK